MSDDCAMIRAEIEANNVQAQKLADENHAKAQQYRPTADVALRYSITSSARASSVGGAPP
jgi:hypothetical protein